jgi:regulator of protease activity HflC (stomatin/prohibitin superfamily)
MGLAELIVGAVVALLVIIVMIKTVRIVPQARARNVERLGRYRKTLEPGMNVIIPIIDRVKPLIDLREQVVSFKGQPVITEDNLVVLIDTVLFFQITDPRAADYEIVNYIQAIEQLTATMLRSVIGSMDLEQTLTSRDRINKLLRGVLDEASGKWGIRVTRVEIKAIDPPKSVKDAMEKQMRAEREKRAAILTAEGARQSQILTAEGDKQGAILRAEGQKRSAVLRAEGQAQAISTVFQSIHHNDPDPKLLAYQYLQMLPQLAQGPGNTFWVIPSEVTTALRAVTSAFGGPAGDGGESRADAGHAGARLAAMAEAARGVTAGMDGRAIGGPIAAADGETAEGTTAADGKVTAAGDKATARRDSPTAAAADEQATAAAGGQATAAAGGQATAAARGQATPADDKAAAATIAADDKAAAADIAADDEVIAAAIVADDMATAADIAADDMATAADIAADDMAIAADDVTTAPAIADGRVSGETTTPGASG